MLAAGTGAALLTSAWTPLRRVSTQSLYLLRLALPLSASLTGKVTKPHYQKETGAEAHADSSEAGEVLALPSRPGFKSLVGLILPG